MFLLTKDLC